jgi:UDP:flavonoid glycosyltransferase YjiC (YdhE family)
VYISSRSRQRRKAFRLSWMRLLSEHWIAYPSFIAGDLGSLEKLKLRVLGRPRVRFLDTVLPTFAAAAPVTGEDFVLVVPGGGTAHPGARDAPQIIHEAAAGLARRGIRTVLAGVVDGVVAPGVAQLTCLPLLPQAQLIDLLRRARIVVSNGGDTLLQALACGCACVAVPIAHDQAARVARCRELGLIADSPLLASAIVAAVIALDEDADRRRSLVARGQAVGVKDAMPQILEWLAALVAAEPHP